MVTIALHNYLMLYDSELSDAEPGYLSAEKEQKFGAFLPHLYSLCGCVIEQAAGDLGLAGVQSAMDTNRFWAEVIKKYDSATGDSSCPHDPMIDRCLSSGFLIIAGTATSFQLRLRLHSKAAHAADAIQCVRLDVRTYRRTLDEILNTQEVRHDRNHSN